MLNRVFLNYARWPVLALDTFIIAWLGVRLSEALSEQYPELDRLIFGNMELSELLGFGIVLALFLGLVGGWYAVLQPPEEPDDVSVSTSGKHLIRTACIVLLPLAALFELVATNYALQEQATNPFAQGSTPTHELAFQWLQAGFFTFIHTAAAGITAAGFLLDIQDQSEAAALADLAGEEDDESVVMFEEANAK